MNLFSELIDYFWRRGVNLLFIIIHNLGFKGVCAANTIPP